MHAIPGWMCGVDFDYELGEALGGTSIFESKEDLNTCRTCTVGDNQDHVPVEVVTMSKEDFLELVEESGIDLATITKSNIGPAIWTKEQGFVK
jgi:hypothetical protein